MYFAIIVYKRAEDCQMLLREPRFLQAKINQVTKKGGNVKFSENPFAASDDEEEPNAEEDEHRQLMEEGGFTIVTTEEETNHGRRAKGSDGVNTVQGIKPEEAREYYLA